MENNKAIEKVYELIEKLNFNELSKDERDFVLNHISEKEYNDIRSTLGDTQHYFANYPEETQMRKTYSLKNILSYRIEIYKIAAALLVLLGIGLLLSKSFTPLPSNIIASVDTVYIDHTDTIYIETHDTIKIVREKIIYRDMEKVSQTDHLASNESTAIEKSLECTRKICPDDLDQINNLSGRNDFSQDKDLTEFMVALR